MQRSGPSWMAQTRQPTRKEGPMISEIRDHRGGDAEASRQAIFGQEHGFASAWSCIHVTWGMMLGWEFSLISFALFCF